MSFLKNQVNWIPTRVSPGLSFKIPWMASTALSWLMGKPAQARLIRFLEPNWLWKTCKIKVDFKLQANFKMVWYLGACRTFSTTSSKIQIKANSESPCHFAKYTWNKSQICSTAIITKMGAIRQGVRHVRRQYEIMGINRFLPLGIWASPSVGKYRRCREMRIQIFKTAYKFVKTPKPAFTLKVWPKSTLNRKNNYFNS